MAAFTLTFAPSTRSFGRSGYNKDGDDSDSKPTNSRGRSGYNDPEEGDSGRSGYNGPDDDDNSQGNKGRSGYNGPSDDDDISVWIVLGIETASHVWIWKKKDRQA
ncbi:hypothetical protein FPOAC1_008468 [Fusarium poae]|uniref:hypothetical protein n=1 Tax=Fusarium poae TaxID=36050 RepID=UPI001CEA5886|nr:hypothetical protein FPOAC1_008468 [Fusarium poae]KAG8669080.1 hypothetical protein FPOAC1_008468 [Fusarium poae]